MKNKFIIFGAGPIGCEYYRLLNDIDLKPLLLTRSFETKNKLAREHEIETFNNLDKSIDNSTIIIALPTKVYPDVLKNFIIKNSNIFIEKPAIYDLKDFKNLNFLQKNNNFIGVCLNRRFYKSIEYIKKLIRNPNL